MLKRTLPPLILLIILSSMPAMGLEWIIPLQEGGLAVSDFTMEDLGLGTNVTVDSSEPNVSASLDDGRIIVVASGDWYGSAFLDLSDDEISVAVKVIVEPLNDPPEIVSLEGNLSGHTVTGMIDLKATAFDPEGGSVLYRWEIDSSVVSTEPHLKHYIMPGASNLTLTVTDEDGMISRMYWELNPSIPPGWGEGPHNHNNRLIYWGLFGSSGSIFIAVMGWILMRGKREKWIAPFQSV